MIGLVLFDLDDTLAPIGQRASEETVSGLRALEAAGARVGICSGKPVDYLCGFARQLGLKCPVLIGENGGVIQLGMELPPEGFHILPISPAARESLDHLKGKLQRRLPELWYQPNLTALTPFPRSAAEFEKLAYILEEEKSRLRDVQIYRHSDCFDVVPGGIDKAVGLAAAAQLLGILPENVLAVGNGANDYPMLATAGYAVGVNLPEPQRAQVCFDCPEQAIDYILNKVKQQA